MDIYNPTELAKVTLPESYVRGGDGIYLDSNELVILNNEAVSFISKFLF